MSFFKRKNAPVIPPVPEQSAPPPSNYGGGRYNSSRRELHEANRAELFARSNPGPDGPNRFAANDRAPEPREPVPGEENEDDVEGIKQQIRATKQESVNSTRNALRLALEAEETARGTLLKLGDQSGAFLSTSRRHGVLMLRYVL